VLARSVRPPPSYRNRNGCAGPPTGGCEKAGCLERTISATAAEYFGITLEELDELL
jgi:hypothetical protein